jgi:hypothetical protein
MANFDLPKPCENTKKNNAWLNAWQLLGKKTVIICFQNK